MGNVVHVLLRSEQSERRRIRLGRCSKNALGHRGTALLPAHRSRRAGDCWSSPLSGSDSETPSRSSLGPAGAERARCRWRIAARPVLAQETAPRPGPTGKTQCALRLHRQPRLRGVGDEPGDLVVEAARVPGTMACPTDLGDRRAMGGAVHPRRVRLEERQHRAAVETAPAARPLALVVAGSPDPAASAPSLGRTPRAHVGHDRVSLFVNRDRLDHRRPVDTEQEQIPRSGNTSWVQTVCAQSR